MAFGIIGMHVAYFGKGEDALKLPWHSSLLCIFCFHPFFSAHFLNLRVTRGDPRSSTACPKFHLPLFPKMAIAASQFQSLRNFAPGSYALGIDDGPHFLASILCL